MLDSTMAAGPTMVMVPTTTTPDTTSSESVRPRLLPRLMLMLICITALFTTPTLVATMAATMVATPATSSASRETAKTDIIRIHRLSDLEIKLLSASSLSSCASRNLFSLGDQLQRLEILSAEDFHKGY